MHFTIELDVERVTGKFVSKQEIADLLLEEVGNVGLDGLGEDGTSEYEIVEAQVL